MPCKWSIRAVLLNDMKMLKEAIENEKQVHSVCLSYSYCMYFNLCCSMCECQLISLIVKVPVYFAGGLGLVPGLTDLRIKSESIKSISSF